MIFVKSQEKGARVAVNGKVKQEFDITFGNGYTQVLSRDEAYQLWEQLDNHFNHFKPTHSLGPILPVSSQKNFPPLFY